MRYTVSMNMLLFLPYYIRWHYTRALSDLFQNCKHFLVFTFSFFSIEQLLKTLFSPWRRLGQTYSGGFDIEDFFGSVIVNTLMRLLGFFIRLIVIVVGLTSTLIVGVCELLVISVWVLMPAILPFLCVISITKLFAL